MRHTSLAFLVLLLAACAFAPAAYAAPSLGFGATSARVADNVTLTTLSALARDFWAARGVAVPTGEIYLVDRCDCGAYDVGADIYVPVGSVADVQAHPTRNLLAGALCTAVVHEEGHAGGLGHTATGVMSADVEIMHAGESWAEVVPWACAKWATERARAPLSGRCRRSGCTRPPARQLQRSRPAGSGS